MLAAEETMRKLLVLAVILVAGYLALQRFRDASPRPKGEPTAPGATTPGANAQQRIDNLSGAAPAEH
jgi:hypothetical protein